MTKITYRKDEDDILFVKIKESKDGKQYCIYVYDWTLPEISTDGDPNEANVKSSKRTFDKKFSKVIQRIKKFPEEVR